jgi:indole-3-glycerol phosphate synthase
MTHKRQELQRRRRIVPLADLKDRAADLPAPIDFAAVLARPGVALIAEIKRASPSRGVFCPDLDPAQLASIYAANGSAAISVLTDRRFFHGELAFLSQIRRAMESELVGSQSPNTNVESRVPLLRKDFIFDPYQVFETRAYGADALLLIASVLPDPLLADLLALTQDLGMSALVEVHNERELRRTSNLNPRVVGVNNRNLQDFSVDFDTFRRLRSLLPSDVVAVAESGVRTAADIRSLAAMGADAALVGEALVTAPDTAAKVRELVESGSAETQVLTSARENL